MANEPITQPVITSIEGAILALKLDHLKEDVSEIVKVMSKMQDTLTMLLRVEEQQRDFRGALDRAFNEIKIERDKLSIISLEMPQYRSLRKWVVGGVVASVGMMGVALFNLLIIAPLYRGYSVQATPPAAMVRPQHEVEQIP